MIAAACPQRPHIGVTARPSVRDALAAQIEHLIDMLDALDGDADFEPELDTAADDFGEAPFVTFSEWPAAFCAVALRTEYHHEHR